MTHEKPKRMNRTTKLSLFFLLRAFSGIPAATAWVPVGFARSRGELSSSSSSSSSLRIASVTASTTTASNRRQTTVRTTALPIKAAPPSIVLPQQKFGQADRLVPTSTTIEVTVSLVKSLVGAGVLALPGCLGQLAASTSNPDETTTTLLAGAALLAAIASWQACCFQWLGQVCAWTGARSYTEAWQRTMGDEASWLVSSALTAKTALACWAYALLVTDALGGLLFGEAAGDPLIRWAILGPLMGLVWFPLCCQENLRALAPWSGAGVAGFFVLAGSMWQRAVDGTYQAGGIFTSPLPFVDDVALVDGIANVGAATVDGGDWISKALVLACTLSTTFVAHYHAPRLFGELANGDDKQNENAEQVFSGVTTASFSLAAVLAATIAGTGFLTFGSDTAPLIWNNYSFDDPLLTGCRALLIGSLVFTFPLPFVGLRDAVVQNWLPSPDEEKQADSMTTTSVTAGLLVILMILAVQVQDLGLVLSVGGGTVSTAVSSIFPAMMYCRAWEQQHTSSHSLETSKTLSSPQTLALCGMTFSGLIGFAGVVAALQQS